MHKREVLKRDFLKEEQGSLSIFIIGIFLLVLALSMAILDVAGNYMAKQELTQIGEAAISRAAHSIDLDRYYRSDRIFLRNSPKGPIYRVPINCQSAFSKFEREIASQILRGNPIYISYWNCYRDALSAKVQSDVSLIIPIPFAAVRSSGNQNIPQSGSGESILGSNPISPPNTSQVVATVTAESIVVGEG